MSMKEIFSAIFSRKSRLASSKAKEFGLGGNMKGDGYQNGGCLVVPAGGGSALFTYRQEHAADHPDNADILKALGLEQKPTTTE
jgi:prostamide/prostaglandin F2alpha synthase